MNEQLFRKKSIERVSSPEQLDAYIRVANPSIWMVLIAIIVLLAGVCIWGILGRVDTTVSAVAVCENGTVTLYVKENEVSAVQPGMLVKIAEDSCRVTEVSVMPSAAQQLPEYACHVGDISPEDWVYSVQTDAGLSDGVSDDGIYNACIVVESIAPMSFVMN